MVGEVSWEHVADILESQPDSRYCRSLVVIVSADPEINLHTLVASCAVYGTLATPRLSKSHLRVQSFKAPLVIL